MNVFPTEKHLASWAGMSPGNNENADKKNGLTIRGNKQVKTVLTEIAKAATRTKNTFYHVRYHKLAERRGNKHALIATGYSTLKSVYHVLSDE
jgi:transposase